MFTWLKKKLNGSNDKLPATVQTGNAPVAWTPAPGTVATTEYQKQGVVFFVAGLLQEAAHCYRQLLLLDEHNTAAHQALGDVHKAQGNVVQAESCYRRALELSPDAGITLYSLGLLLDQKNQFAEAETCYRKALQAQPDDANVHYHLSLNLKSQSRWQESESSCRKALDIKPDFSEAHAQLAASLQQQGRLSEAETSCRQALQLNPALASAHFCLGMLAHQHGKLTDAEAAYRQALALQAGHHGALDYLVLLLQGQGRHAEIEAAYQTAAAKNPGDATALCKLASMQMEFGKLQEAKSNLQKAISIQPDYADAHGTMGILLMSQGQYAVAEACFKQVLKIRPDDAIVFDNLGVIAYQQKRFPDALGYFKRAADLAPGMVNTHNNLASVYKRFGRLQEAADSYQHVLQLDASNPKAYDNLAMIYADQGRLDEAIVLYRKAMQMAPDAAEIYSHLLFALNYHPELSSAAIYAEYDAYDKRFAQPLKQKWRTFSNQRNPQKRLKIGYVSPDLFTHPVRHFLEPLLAHHDKRAFEVYAYSYAQPEWEDAVTRRYQSYVDHWVQTLNMSEDAMAERIRADGIDILIDLAGHTGNHRLQVFARKPAPVSTSWLGFAYTTGVKAIDYMLMDSTCLPAGCEAFFAEQAWRLETPGYAFRPSENMGSVNSLPALQCGHITFGSLSRVIRINDKVIAVWAGILHKVEGAKLIIDSISFAEASMQEAIIAKFEAHGISRSRLEIGFHSPPWDVMRKIDIHLDCFPHNSGTTLFESLYMGTPYITLASRPSMGLLGSSILEGAGHPEWIARSEQEYIDKAAALASDLSHLAQVRRDLREQTQASALMDEKGFTAKVEAAYRSMWARWCEQNPS
ncbi:tetratricopeptide repeat protein [Undibacterium sp. Di27W]|uniref:tetratricopeptide repeat protein n=1 Tax=Undibacterium sp. Di27W TaxID=3413036 RepID=UPI003BF23E47